MNKRIVTYAQYFKTTYALGNTPAHIGGIPDDIMSASDIISWKTPLNTEGVYVALRPLFDFILAKFQNVGTFAVHTSNSVTVVINHLMTH